jgi:hypothetical protein
LAFSEAAAPSNPALGWAGMRVKAFACAVAAVFMYVYDEQAGRIASSVLFTRPGTKSCVPAKLSQTLQHPARPLTEEEIDAFERDGSVLHVCAARTCDTCS